jgi:HK97 family phage portal protein
VKEVTQTRGRWWSRRRGGHVEDRALTREDLPPVMVPSLTAAESVNARTALGLADVWSCVRVLVDGAVMCPLITYRRTDQGRERIGGGRTESLLEQPAPGVTQPALVAQLVSHLALWGEAFLGKVRAEGTITALEVLSPDRVQVQVVNGQPVYTYFAPLGEVFEDLTMADVIHVRGMSLDGIRGASPIALCREALGLSSSLTTAASALWANGAVPAGLLRVPSGPQADEQAQNLAKAWQTRHGGPEQAGRIAVVTGEVNWQTVAMPLADAEFIATRNLSTAEVARIMRVPPWMIGAQSGDSLTYSNTESQAAAFAKFSLGPLLRLIEARLSVDADLFARQNYCEFLLDGLLRADSAVRAGVYTQSLASGWMTVDEVRERENLPPLPRDQAKPDPAAAPFAKSEALHAINAEAA